MSGRALPVTSIMCLRSFRCTDAVVAGLQGTDYFGTVASEVQFRDKGPFLQGWKSHAAIFKLIYICISCAAHDQLFQAAF